jgi:hypothetical protein
MATPRKLPESEFVAESLEQLASHYPPNSQEAIDLRSAAMIRRTIPSARTITVTTDKEDDSQRAFRTVQEATERD